MRLKFCPCCEKTKPTDQFYRYKRGFRTECMTCFDNSNLTAEDIANLKRLVAHGKAEVRKVVAQYSPDALAVKFGVNANVIKMALRT